MASLQCEIHMKIMLRLVIFLETNEWVINGLISYQEGLINSMWPTDTIWGTRFVQVIYNLLFGDTSNDIEIRRMHLFIIHQ